ncbi:phosphoribosylformylglycinamidine cyclo-ligase [Nakamurella leprariae]|uniref:Phosphoribosylformylglycinamidine cyclo-ligase n=1 Tax=Nakamurella leprariae TaxID=2803911 RepID=A0A939C0Y4_9ACTN|nr:phosphoribosylformylglycinamidine cyclo-ligase [Nakamurella leprariae]MBM9466617.1 phosphoribosylformylglycinamidine cyclo-ligase [Nakamurella leprariae]
MNRHPIGPGATYAGSGVSIAAGEAAVDLMKPHARRTHRTEVLEGIGGFASLFRLPLNRFRDPLLASSSDGVGTKTAIAQAMDVHDTIGIDLVAMVVDDVVACGAEPLFLQDYIACGKVEPQRISSIVAGIAEGCVRAGCALVGGETAEHPGLMSPEDYDLAATGVGVVEADAVLGPDRVRAGDLVLGMASSGVHANGFSMVRHVLLDIARLRLDGHVEEFSRTLGEELLEPCRIYALDCLALAQEYDVHAYAHITGGGLANNLARVIPDGLTAVLDRRTWSPPPVFGYIAGHGRVSRDEMEQAFNMGIGMVAVVASDDIDRALAVLTARHLPTVVLGTVETAETAAVHLDHGGRPPRVVLSGDHPRF